jgi:hypothetical protein
MTTLAVSPFVREDDTDELALADPPPPEQPATARPANASTADIRPAIASLEAARPRTLML